MQELFKKRTFRFSAYIASVVLAGLVAACERSVSPAEVPGQESQRFERIPRGPGSTRPEEQPFHDLAKRSPSSAGFYLDNAGRVIVRVASKADEVSAIAFVSAMLDDRVGGLRSAGVTPAGIRVAPATFTFLQLATWRDILFDSVLVVEKAVRTLDLDERENRIELGIEGRQLQSIIPVIEARLGKLGVPRDAVVFQSLDGPEPALDFAPPPTLQTGTTDPLAGGIQIIHSSSACTLGFVAQHSGTTGFVTNSHCSLMPYVVDNTSYTVGGVFAGSETEDPLGYTCGFRVCRGSDANFVSGGSMPLAVGRILRTIGVNSGSLTVDQSRPYFYVVQSGSNLFQGQTVHKVGRTTGWTSGSIVSTCKDATPTVNTVMTCGYEANYGRGGGDSGSPVFVRLASGDSSEVTLVGIHSSESWEAGALFAKLERIQSDLGGTWNVIAHAPTPPSGPLTAAVGGPVDANTSSACTLRYWMNTSGGSGSYSYSWSTNGTSMYSSGGTYWVKFPSAGTFWVEATVGDGTGAQVTDRYYVVASSSGTDCNN